MYDDDIAASLKCVMCDNDTAAILKCVMYDDTSASLKGVYGRCNIAEQSGFLSFLIAGVSLLLKKYYQYRLWWVYVLNKLIFFHLEQTII